MIVDNGHFPWKLFGAELIGTALLVAVGLSFVIPDFGRGSPMILLLPSAAARRFLTGFLFGATGGLIAVSPLGKESGAHINPAVTFAFWLVGRLQFTLCARLCHLPTRRRFIGRRAPAGMGTDGPQRRLWRHDPSHRLWMSAGRCWEKRRQPSH